MKKKAKKTKTKQIKTKQKKSVCVRLKLLVIDNHTMISVNAKRKEFYEHYKSKSSNKRNKDVQEVIIGVT